MVYNFYSSPYDVRDTEADILTNKIADCISQKGKIDSEFFYEGSFNCFLGSLRWNYPDQVQRV